MTAVTPSPLAMTTLAYGTSPNMNCSWPPTSIDCRGIPAKSENPARNELQYSRVKASGTPSSRSSAISSSE